MKKTAMILILLLAAGCSGGKNSSYTGIIEGEVSTVSSPVTDRLIELDVKEGQWVEKGAVLGRIDSTSLELQRKGLEAKRDQLAYQMEDLEIKGEQIEETYRHYNDTWKRYNELLKQNAVSEQTVKDLKLQSDQWYSEKLSLDVQRETLKSQREELEYNIMLIEENIDRAELVAPVSGFVDKIYFEIGEYVPQLRPIIDMVDPQNVWCTIYVSELTLQKIHPGMDVSGKIPGKEYPGSIESISSEAEFTPNEVLTPDNRKSMSWAVKVRFDNPERILKIGMPVDVYVGF